MKIKIKDLGAIKEAVIDLSKKLLIFCGHNGTGKTYLAFVVYFMTQMKNRELGVYLDGEIISEFISNNKISLSLNIEDIWKYRIHEIDKVKSSLWSLFALPENKQEQYFSKTSIEIIETAEEFKNRIFEMEYVWDIKLDNSYYFKIEKLKNTLSVEILLQEENAKNKELMQYLRLVFLSRLYSLLIFHPITSSTIFPVERNSIFTFNNELSLRNNKRIDMLELLATKKDINPLELFFSRNNRYPIPIKDALEVADDLELIQKSKSIYFEFAEEIESDLLKGKIVLSKEGNVEFKSSKAKNVGLSFHQSSSIVKMLASLVIYLKHIAVKNDLIIIDEPELNLHPNNQILLSRIFAKLINNGLRLLISTHSDYIIREINNLLMIGQGDTDISSTALEFGYNASEFIQPNDVQVYMFNYKNTAASKAEVKTVKIEKSGFSVKTIDDTIDKQNTISEELYYVLKYGKALKDGQDN